MCKSADKRFILPFLLSSHYLNYKNEKNHIGFNHSTDCFVILVMYVKTGKNGEQDEIIYLRL
jgi:hypothetical protein